MDNSLTILLALKGRKSFTLRWLEYAKQKSVPYKIIIADGGGDEGLESDIIDGDYHNHINFEYIKYPYDENYGFFCRKMNDALSRVTTPYVIMACNDDLLFFDSMASSVKFLNNNDDYVGCGGHVWDFHVSLHPGGKGDKGNEHIYGDMVDVRKLYSQATVTKDCAAERISEFLSDLHTVWHDVIRTDVLKDAFRVLQDSNIDDIRFWDHFLAFYVSSSGKIQCSDEIFMLHQSHPEMASHQEVIQSKHKWIAHERWNANFDSFVNAISTHMSNVDNINIKDAKCMFMREWFIKYLFMVITREYDVAKENRHRSISDVLKSILSRNDFIYNVVKKMHARLKPAHAFGNMENADSLTQSRINDARLFIKNGFL